MITNRQKARWTANAYQLWLEYAGRYTLNDALTKTAPEDATEDDRQSALAYTIATAQSLHEAILAAQEA